MLLDGTTGVKKKNKPSQGLRPSEASPRTPVRPPTLGGPPGVGIRPVAPAVCVLGGLVLRCVVAWLDWLEQAARGHFLAGPLVRSALGGGGQVLPGYRLGNRTEVAEHLRDDADNGVAGVLRLPFTCEPTRRRATAAAALAVHGWCQEGGALDQ